MTTHRQVALLTVEVGDAANAAARAAIGQEQAAAMSVLSGGKPCDCTDCLKWPKGDALALYRQTVTSAVAVSYTGDFEGALVMLEEHDTKAPEHLRLVEAYAALVLEVRGDPPVEAGKTLSELVREGTCR